MKQKGTPLRRSRRYGIGREIGGCVYVHRLYQSCLGAPVADAVHRLRPNTPYTVVKLNLATRGVTFVVSADFDSAPEPTVGDQWLVSVTGAVRYMPRPADPFIYHHKWTMVADNYMGFDVAANMARSHACLAVPDIDRSRSGKLSYWEQVALPAIRQWYLGRSPAPTDLD